MNFLGSRSVLLRVRVGDAADSGGSQWGGVLEEIELDERTRAKLFNVACFLGVIAVAGFAYMVYDNGGPWEVFSRPKPYLGAPSGLIAEMPMLAYPAILLLAITMCGRTIRLEHMMLGLFFASPHLIMGSLGGRRGPAFLILSALVLSWYVARTAGHRYERSSAWWCVWGF